MTLCQMEARLYGAVTKPVLAFVGTWDPILPDHAALIGRLCNHAREHDLASLLVLIAPAPGMFLLQEKRPDVHWSFYNDTASNVDYLLSLGLDGVLHLDFKKEYLKLGVRELLDTLAAHVEVAEFWFGAHQNFGSGPGGSQMFLLALARERGIRLRRLAESDMGETLIEVRRCLRNGRLQEAIAHTGYPPLRARPADGRLDCVWPAGRYLVLPLDHPRQVVGAPLPVEGALVVELVSAGAGRLRWPVEIRSPYLAFLAGPQELAGVAAWQTPLPAAAD